MRRILVFLLFFPLLVSCGSKDTIIQSLYDISGAPLMYDDSGATKFLHAAAVCMRCAKDKAENLTDMEAMIDLIVADHPEVDLIVFGETILGWYHDPADPQGYQWDLAEPIPGPAVAQIAVRAASYNIYIAFGMGELDGGKLYNTQVLLAPDGTVQAKHRKVHLIDTDEAGGFTPAVRSAADPFSLTITDIDGIRAAMLICADVSDYWLATQINERGVDLIVHSLASFEPAFTIDAVSRQFNAWAIFANRCGREADTDYAGNCYIADPAGTIRAGGEGGQRWEYAVVRVY
ncbi:MAG: carbon-nitrogen hydrolase family protein [Spirochaetales bacterium]|nr:carbon-nitrogen hydrolase family protein [Spirochaetales bacterium]